MSDEAHDGGAGALATVELPDGRQPIASGDGGGDGHDGKGLARLRDPSVTSQQHAALAGHTGWISELAMVELPDGRQLLASAGHDDDVNTVRLWDPVSGRQHGELISNPAGWPSAVVKLPSGQRLLTSCHGDDRTGLWDPVTGQQQAYPVGHTAGAAALRLQSGSLRRASAPDGISGRNPPDRSRPSTS
jgi:WD40 repeat protein